MKRRAVAAALISTAALGAVAAGRVRAAEAAVPPADAPHLVADLSQRRLVIYTGDNVVESFPVAVGKDSKPTPRGTFHIRKIVWNPAWVPPDEKWAKGKTAKDPGEKGNPMKVVKIFFQEPDYYIHGTDDTESLGTAASHGCLRMDPSQVAEVAQYLMNHGGAPKPASWFYRVTHFRSQTKVVYLSDPITLQITG